MEIKPRTCRKGQSSQETVTGKLAKNITGHPLYWKVVAELWKTAGFLASRGEEFNPGPVMRLDHSELLCNKVFLQYKSFWHRHQNRAERVPPLLVLTICFISFRRLLIWWERHLKAEGVSPGPSPTIFIFEIGWHKVYHPPAIKTIDRNTGLLSLYQPKVSEKNKSEP